MQSRGRTGEGQHSSSHPALVDVKPRLVDTKNAEDRARHAGGRDVEPAQSDTGGSADETDPLLSFAPETPPADGNTGPALPTPRPVTWSGPRTMLVAFGALVFVAVIGALGVNQLGLVKISIPGPPPGGGRLTVETKPSGAQVMIDGQLRGTTPVTLSMHPGAYTMTVRNGSDERVVALSVTAGAEVSQYFEMKMPELAIAAGLLSVVTEPTGARVSVDGRPVGVAPVTALEFTAGLHKVTVTSDTGSAERTVTVGAGATASVVFSLPKVLAPLGGWLSLSAPFDVQIVEDGDVIGSGGAAKIMLAGGRHDVVLVSRPLGYQDARQIEITPGKVTAIRIDPPLAMLSANARPWADVLIDGTSVGQTPLANLAVPIGTHQVLFRHPQLGERRENVVVSTNGPNRIAVDFTK